MATNRRTFLKISAAAAGAGALGAVGASGLPSIALGEPARDDTRREPVERAATPLDILILGGTGFTGPEQVEYATARGHRVTLINRNQTRPISSRAASSN